MQYSRLTDFIFFFNYYYCPSSDLHFLSAGKKRASSLLRSKQRWILQTALCYFSFPNYTSCLQLLFLPLTSNITGPVVFYCYLLVINDFIPLFSNIFPICLCHLFILTFRNCLHFWYKYLSDCNLHKTRNTSRTASSYTSQPSSVWG